MHEQYSLDINQLIKSLEQGNEKAKQAVGKDLLLFVGNTGSGKSTLVNYLAGCELYQQEHSQSLEDVVEARNPVTEIGHEKEAKTRYPGIYTDENFTYCDCPGFGDDRGPEVDISNAIAIKNVIQQARSVKAIIIVVNYASLIADRGRGLSEAVEAVQYLLKGQLSDHETSILMVINRVPSNKSMEKIKNFVKGSSKHETLESRILSNNVILYDPLNQEVNERTNRLQFIEKLKALLPIQNKDDVFHYAISKKSQLALDQLISVTSKEIREALKKEDFQRVAQSMTMLRQLSTIEEIKNAYGENLGEINGKITSLTQEIQRFLDTENYSEIDGILDQLFKARALEDHLPILQVCSTTMAFLLEHIKKEKPKKFICPISSTLMTDPVIASDGYIYNRSSIELNSIKKSPVTGDILTGTLTPNVTLQAEVMEYIENRIRACIHYTVLSRQSGNYELAMIFLEQICDFVSFDEIKIVYRINLLEEYIVTLKEVLETNVVVCINGTSTSDEIKKAIESYNVCITALLCKSEQYDKAAQYYTGPDNHKHVDTEYIDLLFRGFIHFLKREGIEKHLEGLSKALKEQNRESAEIYFLLGVLYQDEKRFDESKQCYQDCIRVNFNFTPSHDNLCKIWEDEGELSYSIKNLLHRLLAQCIDPEHTDVAKKLMDRVLELYEKKDQKKDQILVLETRDTEIIQNKDIKKIWKTLFECIRYLNPDAINGIGNIKFYLETLVVDEYEDGLVFKTTTTFNTFQIRLKSFYSEEQILFLKFFENIKKKIGDDHSHLSVQIDKQESIATIRMNRYLTIQERDELIYAIKLSTPGHPKAKMLTMFFKHQHEIPMEEKTVMYNVNQSQIDDTQTVNETEKCCIM